MDFGLLFEVGRRDWTFCVRRAGTPKKTTRKARKDHGAPPITTPGCGTAARRALCLHDDDDMKSLYTHP